MPKIIGYGQTVQGLKKGRHYIFEVLKDENAIITEDITIAAILLCRGYKYSNRKIVAEYKPGRFAGTFFAEKFTRGGEAIFAFKIEGDKNELYKRMRLFHAGAHFVDPKEMTMHRNNLLDALNYAKETRDRDMKGETDGRKE